MRKLTAAICLTFGVLLGSAGASWAQVTPSLNGLRGSGLSTNLAASIGPS